MSFFGFGKKKEENKSACCCGSVEIEEAKTCCCDSGSQIEEPASCCGSKNENSIKVLGSGCKNCHNLFEAAKEAVSSLGLSMAVDYVTDMEKIMEYGVMSMPVLVVNEKVVSMGKVLKAAEVKKLLQKEGF